MPQVQVTIGGRSYRLACNPGEEEHLARLGALVDAKISDIRGAFRDIDDQRIVVMAALGVADELLDARRKAESQAGEATAALAAERDARAAAEARAARLEAAIEETTLRIEALTESLNAIAEA
jgi:cell division protein ZapA